MTRKTTLAALVAWGLLAVALPQRPGQAQTTPSPSADRASPTQPHVGRGTEDDVSTQPVSFEAADKDKNGKLDRSEASSIPRLDFARADSDGDSYLSRQEFQLAMVTPPPRG